VMNGVYILVTIFLTNAPAPRFPQEREFRERRNQAGSMAVWSRNSNVLKTRQKLRSL
jgi:hypothetical protein